ncbi:MAG: PfkB family carbohydrate kinase [Candidatus Promineifilaceae bacterium]|nr:PfkB family carbohydrate kinase [Candidatus Promineifilaceae bacterium]
MMSPVDYLVIGHVTRDVGDATVTLGGTVAYAGLAAHALGCTTAILTSADADCDLSLLAPLKVNRVPAGQTTTFENRYQGERRLQWVRHTAQPLAPAHLPRGWASAPIVHLAPVAGEVDPAFISHFQGSLIGMTIQGWLRGWDASGRVSGRLWEAAQHYLPLADAVILSDEDLPDPALLAHYRAWARLLVVTSGAGGCTVFLEGEQLKFPAPTVDADNLTGAGDIFAAAFLIHLNRRSAARASANWEVAAQAARFANEVAAESVTQPDLRAKVTRLRRFREQLERERTGEGEG